MKTLLMIFVASLLTSCVSYVKSGRGVDLDKVMELQPGRSTRDSVLKSLGSPDRIVTNGIEGTEIFMYESFWVKSVAVGVLPWAILGRKADNGYQIALAFKGDTYLGYTLNQFNQNLIEDNSPDRSYLMKKMAASGNCFEGITNNNEWGHEKQLKIVGFKGNAMEPDISPDGNELFFNDKPATDTLMQIHWATRDRKDSSGLNWIYKGVVKGASVDNFLDGTPSVWMDPGTDKLKMSFVSVRDYDSSSKFGTLYIGDLKLGETAAVVDPKLADEQIQAKIPGDLIMDGNVSADGKFVITSEAKFSGKPYPDFSDLKIHPLSKDGQVLAAPDLSSWTANVNRPACRTYAGNMSANKLELYYTALEVKGAQFTFKILVAKRERADVPFKKGQIISAIKGELTEGTTLSRNGKQLYYHKKASDGNFAIFRLER